MSAKADDSKLQPEDSPEGGSSLAPPVIGLRCI